MVTFTQLLFTKEAQLRYYTANNTSIRTLGREIKLMFCIKKNYIEIRMVANKNLVLDWTIVRYLCSFHYSYSYTYIFIERVIFEIMFNIPMNRWMPLFMTNSNNKLCIISWLFVVWLYRFYNLYFVHILSELL